MWAAESLESKAFSAASSFGVGGACFQGPKGQGDLLSPLVGSSNAGLVLATGGTRNCYMELDCCAD